jgi:hypothetical protein
VASGFLRFTATTFVGTVWRRFPRGEINNADAQILLTRDSDQATYADFCIVRMRCDNQDVKWVDCNGRLLWARIVRNLN